MGFWDSITKSFRRTAAGVTPRAAETPANRQRSTEDLQRTLIDLVHGELQANMLRTKSDDPAANRRAQNNMNLGVTLTANKIKALQRDTMIAILKAAEHPRYRIANSLRRDSGMAEDETQVRDVALLFDVLHKSKAKPAYYGTALSRLKSITKTDNLFPLMNKSPEYTRAILRLVLHFTNKFGGPLDMDPALRAIVKNAPETADDIIAYADQRGLTKLESITSEELLNWQKTTPALRDGAL